MAIKRVLKLRFVRLFLDLLFAPIITLTAPIHAIYRKIGSHRLPLSTFIFKKIGVFPIRDHFYEPFLMIGMQT